MIHFKKLMIIKYEKSKLIDVPPHSSTTCLSRSSNKISSSQTDDRDIKKTQMIKLNKKHKNFYKMFLKDEESNRFSFKNFVPLVTKIEKIFPEIDFSKNSQFKIDTKEARFRSVQAEAAKRLDPTELETIICYFEDDDAFEDERKEQ